jgi:hypothetical protein
VPPFVGKKKKILNQQQKAEGKHEGQEEVKGEKKKKTPPLAMVGARRERVVGPGARVTRRTRINSQSRPKSSSIILI